ncbi:FadR/GntR family transcriptional regulator [Paenibacillus oleatilyticus]|uniref:FadR/GntR family transcriptional regulator n=1 Tax=Paenibacillus oleatilyticus TaxID=2594886 RepID=UPI001C1FD95B|nr:FadR/GntR family transcriptional regulator [Paenibacillus oleatilyticus]MBU7318097.1 FadR family transcriptional regulator [Paenibacillus oleatilyticus]
MELKQTTRSTLVEQVVSQMESLIESGQWPVGSRIPVEPELVKQLGVSRNTVREGVRALIHAGLLTARQGDGTYVRSSSSLGPALVRRLRRSNATETLEVRCALEQEAARLAALRRTPEEIETFRSLLSACDAAAAAQDIEGYIEADLKLHLAIVQATRNSVLIDLYEHMTDALESSIDQTLDLSVIVDGASRSHCQMVDAIAAQDPVAAAEAVRRYIRESLNLLQEDVRKEGSL